MTLPPDVIETMARAAKAELWVSPDAQLNPIRGTADAIRAALSALADSGWVAVPKEPTAEMMIAAVNKEGSWAAYKSTPREIYIAMIEAAHDR